MGKRQHQKDKMYLTTTEWSQTYGGYKASSHKGEKAKFRRLPFANCCLSMLPFEHPYMDNEGNMFDLEAVLPFIKKFKVNPVSGKPLSDKHLTKLNMYKSSAGDYHCPVLYKTFTNNTHMVANKKTGNVFSYEAVEQLNIKVSFWKDLLNDEPFTRNDLIVLQDPKNLTKFNLSTFHHIKNKLKVVDEEIAKSRTDASLRLKNVTKDTQEILSEYSQSQASKLIEKKEEKPELADKFNAAHYSTGKVSSSFTSTSVNVETQNNAAVLQDDVVRYSMVKKKGYVSFNTSQGPLNLEIYCDVIHKASENFIRHCDNGYYDGTKFHRSIRHFMIQGGDPEGNGEGGQSIWGAPFKDEFRQHLQHKGRGILSMANSGPDTNKSQFFITYRSCQHLDGKHTVFGRVVGGLQTLSAMEAIETDNKDRPIEDITIINTSIFVDPFKEADEKLAEERQKEREQYEAEQDELKSRKRPKVSQEDKVYRSGVGKFVDLLQETSKDSSSSEKTTVKKKSGNYAFKDFSIF